MAVHLYEKYREDVAVVLSSKLDEFKVFDYDQVSEDDLWNFLLTKNGESRGKMYIFMK